MDQYVHLCKLLNLSHSYTITRMFQVFYYIRLFSRTQNVLNYQKTLLSAKKEAKLQEIREQFVSVTDENAIILNNKLEEIEK